MGITYWVPEKVAFTQSFQRCGRAKKGHFPFHRNRTMKADAQGSGGITLAHSRYAVTSAEGMHEGRVRREWSIAYIKSYR